MSQDRIARRASGALVALALIGVASTASAQGYGYAPPPPPPRYDQTPGLDRHQALQREWLRQGIANRRITHQEAERIRGALANLQQHERNAKADGYVSPAERAALRDHAQRVDALISRNYYDGQVRPPVYRDLWR